MVILLHKTAGTQTNTSTAAGNTVADGTKSTATTADGTKITDGTKQILLQQIVQLSMMAMVINTALTQRWCNYYYCR